MRREIIVKEINQYVNKKICIMCTYIVAVVVILFFVILDQFVKHDFFAYGTVVMYVVMLVVMFIAIRFDLNKKLAKVITKDDYIEILKYMSEIPDSISEWKYYERILMIKRTLNDMVYYHMYEVDEVVREYLCYLQTFLKDNNRKQRISSKALNRPHLRAICKKLLEQIEQGDIKRAELDSLTEEDKSSQKNTYKTIALISNPCNILLITIVFVKVIVTIIPDLYKLVNDSLVWRIPYNTATDVVAAVLAMIALKEKQ